jgi:hypothetical protein
MNKMTAIAVGVLLLAACGDSGTPMPTPAVSTSEIQRLSAEADAFAQSHMGAWPDVDAYVADLAEDVTGADPSARDSGGGKAAAVSMWKMWELRTDHTMNVTGTFISADGAAYKERWPGLKAARACKRFSPQSNWAIAMCATCIQTSTPIRRG